MTNLISSYIPRSNTYQILEDIIEKLKFSCKMNDTDISFSKLYFDRIKRFKQLIYLIKNRQKNETHYHVRFSL